MIKTKEIWLKDNKKLLEDMEKLPYTQGINGEIIFTKNINSSNLPPSMYIPKLDTEKEGKSWQRNTYKMIEEKNNEYMKQISQFALIQRLSTPPSVNRTEDSLFAENEDKNVIPIPGILPVPSKSLKVIINKLNSGVILIEKGKQYEGSKPSYQTMTHREYLEKRKKQELEILKSNEEIKKAKFGKMLIKDKNSKLIRYKALNEWDLIHRFTDISPIMKYTSTGTLALDNNTFISNFIPLLRYQMFRPSSASNLDFQKQYDFVYNYDDPCFVI